MRYYLSGVYSQMNDNKKAEEELLKIVDAPSRPDPRIFAGANNDLGFLWVDEGRNLDRTERVVRLALKSEPDNPAYLDSLGWASSSGSEMRKRKASFSGRQRRGPGTIPSFGTISATCSINSATAGRGHRVEHRRQALRSRGSRHAEREGRTPSRQSGRGIRQRLGNQGPAVIMLWPVSRPCHMETFGRRRGTVGRPATTIVARGTTSIHGRSLAFQKHQAAEGRGGRQAQQAVQQAGSARHYGRARQPDPKQNSKLAFAISKAKSYSLPHNTIEKAIEKGSRRNRQATTSNKSSTKATAPAAWPSSATSSPTTATAPPARSARSSNVRGGKLGATDCVAYMFQRKGQFIIDAAGRTEDE